MIVRSLASSFRVAAILLLANAIGANAQAPTAQIDRVLFVPLGGIDQWISIRGENRANPVVLVVHGGPGEAQWPQAEVYRPWEKGFVVVQWDQRGAGHTFGRYGTSTPDVTLDRISKDCLELAEYLCHELGKKKIIVVGHSWGSLVATHMVQMRPDLFAAYVGTGQAASWNAMINIHYDLLLAKARRDADQATVKELEAIGRPGPTNGDHWSFLGKYKFRSLWAPSDQEWLRHLRSQAAELKARVIMTVTALHSRIGIPLVGGYGPAQAAKESLTRSLSAELAPHGIRVVGLRPQGMPETATIKRAYEPRAKASGMTWEQWQTMLASRTHPRRLMTLEEMANLAVFVASDKASGLTGTTINLTMGSLDD